MKRLSSVTILRNRNAEKIWTTHSRGATGAPLFQQRNSLYPQLTLSTHRSTNLDLHACGQKKIPMPMAHASKCSLSKNLVYSSMEGGLLNSVFLRLYLNTIPLTNTQVLSCQCSSRQHIISEFTC